MADNAAENMNMDQVMDNEQEIMNEEVKAAAA